MGIISKRQSKGQKGILSKKEVGLIVLMGIIGLLSGGLLGFSQMGLITEEMKEEIISELGSEQMLYLVSAIQVCLMTLVTTLVGIILSKKVNLKLHTKFSFKGVWLAVGIGFLSAFIIIGADKWVFWDYVANDATTYRFSISYFLASVLYGGIIEEVLLRLFLMSLIVWLLQKLTKTPLGSSEKQSIYVIAIFMAALLFALGHLPATLQLVGSSLPIMIRMFLLNGLAGLGFGYLYWKRGLSHAMLAHIMTHVFGQLVFIPLLF